MFFEDIGKNVGYSVRPPIIHTYQRRGRKVIGQINNEEGKRGGDRAGGAQAQK